MSQQSLHDGVAFTKAYEGVWYVYLDGQRVGTVNGDSSFGFTARNIDYHCIGRDYVSAEAAMDALVNATRNHS